MIAHVDKLLGQAPQEIVSGLSRFAKQYHSPFPVVHPLQMRTPRRYNVSSPPCRTVRSTTVVEPPVGMRSGNPPAARKRFMIST